MSQTVQMEQHLKIAVHVARVALVDETLVLLGFVTISTEEQVHKDI